MTTIIPLPVTTTGLLPLPVITAGLSVISGIPIYQPTIHGSNCVLCSVPLVVLHQQSLVWMDVNTTVTPFEASPSVPCIIQIIVQTLSGHTIYLTGQPYDTIETIKHKIQDKEGIPPDQQILTFQGREIENKTTLSECNILRLSQIHFILRLCGGGPGYKLPADLLDPSYDFDFTDIKDNQTFYRGETIYIRPYGWKRIALNVINKYPDTIWLGFGRFRTKSEAGEWAVSYHGTNKFLVPNIAEEGFKLNKGRRFAFGRGIYSTPYPEIAAHYAPRFKVDDKTYQVLLQNRVNHHESVYIESHKYFVTPREDGIRPYGVLIREMPSM